MATRIYLPSSGAAAVTPAYMAWTGTSQADRLKCVTSRTSSVMTSKTGNALAGSAAETVLLRQYVSNPLDAQTISGSLTGQIRCIESNTGVNGTLAIGVQVCTNDGTAIRGTLLAISASDNTAATPPEFATALTNRQVQDVNEATSLTLTSLAVSAGDRLVIEVGFREVGTTTTRTASLSLGDDNATDLPVDNTTTAANNPWVQFSGTITFQATGVPDGMMMMGAGA